MARLLSYRLWSFSESGAIMARPLTLAADQPKGSPLYMTARNRTPRNGEIPVISNDADVNGTPENGELNDADLLTETEEPRSVPAGAVEATPPPGVPVTHTHQMRWSANAAQTAQNTQGFTPTHYSDAPVDPLREFLEQFNDGDFYTMQVTRDPDPMLKRPPNPTYARPCFVREILANGIPLIAQSFIDDLRALNGNSGGNFSVAVYDSADQFVDAWHGNIGDPIILSPPAAPAAQVANPPVDDMTKFLNMLRQQAEMMKLSRTIAGVPEGGVQPTAAPVDPKLQLAALLIEHGDVVGNITRKVSETVERVVADGGGNSKPTSFIDAMKQAIATNPKLQTRLAQTVDKIVDVGARAVGVETGQQLPPNAAPERELQMSENDDENVTDTDADLNETDNAEAVLMDFLVNECAEGRNVTFQHPVFTAYGEHAPDNYNTLLTGLKMMGAEQLIEIMLTRAAEFDRASVYRLVLKRPEGIAWVQHLQASAINSQPLPTTE